MEGFFVFSLSRTLEKNALILLRMVFGNCPFEREDANFDASLSSFFTHSAYYYYSRDNIATHLPVSYSTAKQALLCKQTFF